MTTNKGAISQFIEKYYLHFNAASVVDAAKEYENQLAKGSKKYNCPKCGKKRFVLYVDRSTNEIVRH